MKEINPAVRYEDFPVSGHLKQWVCGFFHWSGASPERILPNGQADLLFSLNGEPIDSNESRVDRRVRTVLYGELRQPLSGLGHGEVDIFGVSLFPWAAEVLAGICVRDLEGKVLPLQSLGQVDCERIRAMLTDCVSDLERIRLMEEILSRLLPAAGVMEKRLHEHWMELWRRAGQEPFGEDDGSAEQAKFQRVFHRQVGMTVRQFSRLARFHAFLRRLEGGEKISTLAQDIGYYDQAHLTRECRDFAGIPPRQLHVQLASGHTIFRRDRVIGLQ